VVGRPVKGGAQTSIRRGFEHAALRTAVSGRV